MERDKGCCLKVDTHGRPLWGTEILKGIWMEWGRKPSREGVPGEGSGQAEVEVHCLVREWQPEWETGEVGNEQVSWGGQG